MPASNTYDVVMGSAPPHPTKIDFLRYNQKLIETRRRQSTGARTGPTYYIASSGSSGNNGTSTSTPKDIGSVNGLVSALTAQNEIDGARILFRRGDLYRLTAKIASIDKDNILFGVYGESSMARPVFSFFSILFNSGLSWTNQNSGTAAKNRWTIALSSASSNPSSATRLGWIAEVADPFNPYMYVTSATAVEDNPRSFWIQNQGSSATVHINPGYLVRGTNTEATKRDPGTINFEATPAYATAAEYPIAFEVGLNDRDTGKCWFQNLSFRGWGCAAIDNCGSTCSIKFESGNDAANYVSDCDEYYSGRHHMSQETGSIEGGYAVWERIDYGYISQANTLGSTHLNSYAGLGKNESYYIDCTQRFGSLPDQWASFANKALLGHGEISFTGPMFAHSSSDSFPIGYWVSINTKTEDNRGQYPYATCGYLNDRFTVGNCPGTDTDPTSWRVYWINRDCRTNGFTGTTESANGSGRNVQLGSRAWYINPKIRYHKSWTGSNLIQSVDGFFALVNADFEVRETTTSQPATFFSASVANNLRVWWYGGRFRTYADMAIAQEPAGQLRATFFAGAAATNLRIAGVVLENAWQKTISLSNISVGGTPTNSNTIIRYLAGHRITDADETWRRGFNQATGYIDLDGVNGGRCLSGTFVSDDSPLLALIPARPFDDVAFDYPEYDFDFKQRPTSRAIGLYDLFAKSSGGGIPASGASPSTGSDGFVRGVI